MRLHEAIGQRFGKILVVSAIHKPKSLTKFLCRCDCGATTTPNAWNVIYGITTSCGCRQKERASSANLTHGKSQTSIYRRWAKMKERCLSKDSNDFKHYGGRGIKVCDRWMKFENFCKDMGEIPPGTTLERINNEGNYEPGNCRWATWADQKNNTRQNIKINIGGIIKTAAQWARHAGLSYWCMITRINLGWSGEKLLTPVRVKK